jgi:serine/threonine protein kinase
MAQDVFLSYSSQDEPIADVVRGTLEGEEIRCWMAPRDVLPGIPYGEAIIEAIQSSRLMVLVFSSNSNNSPQVMREVERAVSKGIPIIPLRIEQVPPSKSLEYFISAPHWLDALTPPLEKHLHFLAETVHLLLSRHGVRCHSRDGEPQAAPPPVIQETIPAPASPSGLPQPFPGEYVIRRSLGEGAFGQVWLADDVKRAIPVALKTIRLRAGVEQRSRALATMQNEARALARLRHPNIVQVYNWRQAGGDDYLVLQYVPGQSLKARLEAEGPLGWPQAARYVADVAEGLLEVHARGIIHRDVKSANLLWDPETDEALLTDFGISARLADSGTIAGTPYYMPPEAFEGQLSPAQDVYGLAASLFWLVTGSVPFPGQTREQIAEQARRGLPDPDPRCVDLPQALEQLIRAGLAEDPRRRPGLPEFVASLRGRLNHLLADSLLSAPARAQAGPASLRLTVCRQEDYYTFVPVATTRPQPERLLRDLRRVPPRPERVDVRTGDRVRIEVETDRPGYVTVFNVGPTGNLNLLYPAEPSPPAAVSAHRPLHVLDIELTPPAGQERLFALWNREPLPLRLDELLGLAEHGRLPASEPYRATRDMKRVQESIRDLSPEDWQAVVLELNHAPSPTSRPD